MDMSQMLVLPRFGRGQERPGDSPAKHRRPNFAAGRSAADVTDDSPVGHFATGQEHAIHHPERHYAGRFGRGQERSAGS
jgi:hypothetical protein